MVKPLLYSYVRALVRWRRTCRLELPSIINPVSSARDSSPGGFMRQQTKPFTVEIKQSRKLKPTDRTTSIWGKLDLTPDQGTLTDREQREVSAVGGDNDRL